MSVPGIRESLDLGGHVRLKRWVARAATEAITGALRVSGRPGGVLQFRDGMVVVAESPGAPGVQALLIRTGRVSDEEWARDGGADHTASAARIGAAHRQVLQLMANQDALFAVLLGSIDACVLQPDPAGPASGQGQDAAALLDAAFRKLDALALLPRAVLPHRERLVARATGHGDGVDASGAAGSRPSELRQVVLAHADGRRTARDIAFVSGRSLYAVTVEMSRMLAEGLLREPPPGTEAADTSPVRVLPRRPAPAAMDGAANTAAASGAACDHAAPAETEDGLPRRRPPAEDATEDSAGQKTAPFWRDFLHRGGRMGDSRN